MDSNMDKDLSNNHLNDKKEDTAIDETIKQSLQEYNCNDFNKSYINNTKHNSKVIQSSLLNYVFSENLQKFFKNTIGNYYTILHILIALFGSYIIIFSMNPYHLLILMNVLAIDAFTIIILHDCPLTMLERYYIKHSSVFWRLSSLRNLGIKYTSENEYDLQLEVIINSASICILKNVLYNNF